MSDVIIVRDDGFHPAGNAPEVLLAPDTDPEQLVDHLHRGLVAIDFPAMTDGRGFSLARRLRALGYTGQLRATGKLIADQYAMARRVGFDEVEIPAELAARQPQEQWLARADWQDWNHRDSLAG
ncbi:DUF934 domain-containing protein [Paracoccus tegillarcae]|uniref:DUF934 domain-containing protein n=1 Tax=Paracoccus tegillarcae TaxID=1529068 RepID=A0A2K9F0J4_9RHOB|nr:DUF934 domain-containing protein [Paracoccus tegillarcae]AUH33882.1 hypothetical protein CUV01_11215 [Paracoccus tegillarcae]